MNNDKITRADLPGLLKAAKLCGGDDLKTRYALALDDLITQAQAAPDEAVVEIVSGYSGDPDTRNAKALRILGELPSVGTKLYTHPAPAQPAEEL